MRLWLVAAVLLAPLASAQVVQPSAVPTTLHFHVINVQDMPINTQEPPEDYISDSLWGPAQMTLRCAHPTTGDVGASGVGTGGVTSQDFSKSYGYSSPFDVEYGFRSANGSPRTRPERGLAADVTLADGVTPVLTWYVAVGAPMGYQDIQTPPYPAPVPNVHVVATVRVGDAISVDDKSYDEGRILMQGTSASATLAADQVVVGPSGLADGVRALGLMGDRWVYEFTFPLQIIDPVIPAQTGYNVRVDVAFDLPQCDPVQDMTLLPASVASFTGPAARPRLDLSVDQAFVVHHAVAEWQDDDLVLRLGANSVWGEGDLDIRDLRIEIAGPGQAHFVKQAPPPYYHEHGHPPPDPEVVWVWEGASKEAPRGHYDVLVTIPNRQHTADLQVTLGFDVEPAREAPGLEPLAILGLVAMAAFLRRR